MHFENIIIGAGPAGVQLAYYFEQNNIQYVILEKTEMCGSFFYKYPHTSKLISINKKYTGNDDTDFNLRHDWNSLLNEDDFLLKDYTDEFYPDHKDLNKYINDFAYKYKLKIQYNTTVKKINKLENKYEIFMNNDEDVITCGKLIIATGLSIPNYPNFTFKSTITEKINHYADFPKGYFKDDNNLSKYILKLKLFKSILI
jgi:cation diffusion facilitator CzcD-associated flavoprotein CzcO